MIQQDYLSKADKQFFLIALFYSLSFGQGWNSTVTTSINEPNLEKMDMFTNKDGNHIIIKRTDGYIVYYRINTSGTVKETDTLNTNGDFPNIVGSNDKIYALYKSGNFIKGKYSTNAGASWANLPNRAISSNTCNGIDAVYEVSKGVHLVYATKDSDPNYETYYYLLNTNDTWVDYKNITDVANYQYGGNPSVAVSDNRVQVSFNTNYFSYPVSGDVKTRDKNGSTWQNPQNAVTGSDQSMVEKLVVRGSNLFLIYAQYVSGIPIRVDLANKYRSLTSTSWGSSSDIVTSVDEDENVFNVVKTYDDKIHLVYGDGDLQYRSYNGSWSSATTLDTDPMLATPKGISFSSNDVYVTWMHDGSDYLRYRQNDAVPLTPPNFSGQFYNNHPKLTWDRLEPDIEYFEIWWQIVYDIKNPGSWNLLTTTTNTSFIDNGVELGGTTIGTVNYKIRSKDLSDNYSSYTSIVSFNFSGLNKVGGENSQVEYSLKNNYPNPFNPSTQIKYSLAQDADVTLKVYDMLGTEVVELVNGTQRAGNHNINFNANNLSSGVYIYRIMARQNGRVLFTDSKRMVLLR